MSGNIGDQDLTNYALNDGLDPRERLYVESLLGASEESRGDVYKMLDLAQMLEEGFEQETEELLVPTLTMDQRAALVAGPATSPYSLNEFLRKTAASLALAACVAFALANPRFFQSQGGNRTMAAMSSMVNDALSPDEESDIASWVNPPTVNDEDSGTLIQASSDGMPQDETIVTETVCTPPSVDGAPVAMPMPAQGETFN